MGNLKIQCTCRREFETSKNMLIEHRQDDGLIEVFYYCPHCKRKHHVCYLNNEAKNIQKLIDKARSKGNVELCRELCKRKKMLMDQLNKRL